MKSIILAAGYATRLYPLTQNFPKPLLKVQGVTILDRLLKELDAVPEITEHIIISNHKFISIFKDWKAECGKAAAYTKKITLLDDGSTDNEHRLGAVKDILFAVTSCHIQDDIFVLAGDNVLDFALAPFVRYYIEKNSTVIMRHEQNDITKLRKTGVIEIDADDTVLSMQEKPAEPKSHWAVPPFYIYPAAVLPELQKGIDAGCATDAPGDFIAWFCSTHTVHAWRMTGKRYDVGDVASYNAVQNVQL